MHNKMTKIYTNIIELFMTSISPDHNVTTNWLNHDYNVL